VELKQLEHFVTVAQEGGFAPAARALGLTQPSLTRSIAALEKGLGVKLFDRKNLGATLNNAGHELLPHATAILQEAKRAQFKFVTQEAGPRREPFRLGISPNLLFSFLPDHLRPLLDGDDEIAVTTGTYESLTDALRIRKLDMVLCTAMAAAPVGRPHTDFAVQCFGEEDVVPAARSDHPVFDEPASLATVAHHRWAIPYQMSVSYRFVLVFNEHGLPPPTQSLSSSSLSLIRRAVSDWGLLGMLPRRMLVQAPAGGKRARGIRRRDCAARRAGAGT
jgi:DNA-binding transcriptional LysR family regulator